MSTATTPADTAEVVDMRARVGPVDLPNPVMTASGTAGHGAELAAYFDLSALGAVVVKSVSLEPWAGNPAPRLLPLPAATACSTASGLQNPGVERVAVRRPAGSGPRPGPGWSSASGASPSGLSSGRPPPLSREAGPGRRRGRRGQHHLPQRRGSPPDVRSQPRRRDGEAVSAAADGLGGALPVWAKLSPNVTDLAAIAGAALAAGAGALTLVNTVMGMAIDPVTGDSRLGGGGGGLSGPGPPPGRRAGRVRVPGRPSRDAHRRRRRRVPRARTRPS